ncbi:MAG: carbonic anhydrase [Vulcanimicrobiaceae bacterium]
MNRTVPPEAALQRLIEGNRRYAVDDSPEGMHDHAVNRRHTMAEQRPFATVIGCSDSRVPIEIVFNQSLGDLFVIRVAGNILNDHIIGSVEYALAMFGSSLVMVLGHSNCGAVTAAVDSVLHGGRPPSRIATIIDEIRPAVESVRAGDDVLEAAIAQNVRNVTAALQKMDPLIATARTQGRLAVVGAEYHLSTGLVTMLCGDLVEPAAQK